MRRDKDDEQHRRRRQLEPEPVWQYQAAEMAGADVWFVGHAFDLTRRVVE
jgi:hypothetical protein